MLCGTKLTCCWSVFSSAVRSECSSGPSSTTAATASATTAVTRIAPAIRPRRPIALNQRCSPTRVPLTCLPLRSSQAIAGAPHGQDVARLLRLRLELFPQMADVDVDRAGIAVCAVAPDRAEQLLAVQQPARVAHQRVEQLELGERQAHRAALDLHLALGSIERDRADRQQLIAERARARAPQHRPDPAAKL